eukprot:gene23545-biopygen2843
MARACIDPLTLLGPGTLVPWPAYSVYFLITINPAATSLYSGARESPGVRWAKDPSTVGQGGGCHSLATGVLTLAHLPSRLAVPRNRPDPDSD